MKIFKRGSMMQEHRQRQASVGHTPTHFGHMMNCLNLLKLDAPKVNETIKKEHTL
jgi:hypothetical protein